jgi:hypothetical protein
MKISLYLDLIEKVKQAGYQKELDWAWSIKECDNEKDFALEAAWVILCSGFKEQAARPLMDRLIAGECVMDVVKHQLKAEAICRICTNKSIIFIAYQEYKNKLDYLETLPHIGKITKYHLAKNLGFDCVKPDRHLVRIANFYNTTPLNMCNKIKEITGHKLAYIDSVIWRAANLGYV